MSEAEYMEAEAWGDVAAEDAEKLSRERWKANHKHMARYEHDFHMLNDGELVTLAGVCIMKEQYNKNYLGTAKKIINDYNMKGFSLTEKQRRCLYGLVRGKYAEKKEKEQDNRKGNKRKVVVLGDL